MEWPKRRLCAVVLQLLDLPRSTRPLPRRSFRQTRISRPWHRQRVAHTSSATLRRRKSWSFRVGCTRLEYTGARLLRLARCRGQERMVAASRHGRCAQSPRRSRHSRVASAASTVNSPPSRAARTASGSRHKNSSTSPSRPTGSKFSSRRRSATMTCWS